MFRRKETQMLRTRPGTLADDIGCALAMTMLGALAYAILAL